MNLAIGVVEMIFSLSGVKKAEAMASGMLMMRQRVERQSSSYTSGGLLEWSV